jgi:CelD/BcsL family acetyltransferase involved in cellulose biosynthesis
MAMTEAASPKLPGKPVACRIDVLDSLDTVETFLPRWRRFVENDASPITVFQTPGWMLSAMRRLYGRDADCGIRLIVVHDGSGIAMIVPLALATVGNIRILKWLGDPLFEYGDVIVRRDCDAARLFADAVAHIARRDAVDAVHLRKVRDDAAVSGYLACHAVELPHATRAPFVALTASITGAHGPARAGARTAKNNRRKRRRLAELGKLSFEVSPAGARARQVGSLALDLKRRWLAERGLISRTLADAACVAAVVEAIGDPETGARVSALSLDERPIAVEVGFVRKGTYYSYLAAIEPEFARFSPGSLQLADTIAWCRANGVECVDLLGPDDGHKRSWSTGSTGLKDWAVPLTLRGKVHTRLMLGVIEPAIKDAYRRSPVPVRRWAKGIAFGGSVRRRIVAATAIALGGIGVAAMALAD